MSSQRSAFSQDQDEKLGAYTTSGNCPGASGASRTASIGCGRACFQPSNHHAWPPDGGLGCPKRVSVVLRSMYSPAVIGLDSTASAAGYQIRVWMGLADSPRLGLPNASVRGLNDRE